MDAVDQLARGAQVMAHSLTMMSEQIRTLQDANAALAKRRRAKRTRVQLGGALSIELEWEGILEPASEITCFGAGFWALLCNLWTRFERQPEERLRTTHTMEEHTASSRESTAPAIRFGP
ncbi:hypothetical protein F5883DRAFT_225303 [Diaporthe sp. PMI_573]|nr:hypothetical protein F5883DRAFT_225303 [Diaporthaceae sp. PMI_573]